MADTYKVVRSPEIEDQEYPEIHKHNDIDQPAIDLQDLPSGTDHSTLSNVTIDQHHARDHVTRHLSGGGDAFTGANLLTPLEGAVGIATYTQGDILYSSAANTLAKLAKNTTATRYLSNTGTSNNPAWAQVNLANGVTGTLPLANGGFTVTNGRSTAQTAAVASVATTTLGGSDGSFVVSANVLVTTSTTHNFTVTCAYTDEGNTARTLTFNFSSLAGVIATTIINTGGAVPYEGVPMHIRCKASTAITIATTGTFTTVTYNVEGSIVQIA